MGSKVDFYMHAKVRDYFAKIQRFEETKRQIGLDY